MMNSQSPERANYTPLRRQGGSEATGRCLPIEKNANMDICGFFFFSARGYSSGLLLPR